MALFLGSARRLAATSGRVSPIFCKDILYVKVICAVAKASSQYHIATEWIQTHIHTHTHYHIQTHRDVLSSYISKD